MSDKVELTREEENQQNFLKREEKIKEENAKENYRVDKIEDIGELVGELLIRLSRMEYEKMAEKERYKNHNEDILKIREQEAITKLVAEQLYENNTASISKGNLRYDFDLDNEKKNISLVVTDIEKNIKLEEVEFPFKKYYLEKEDKVEEKEAPKKEILEKEVVKETAEKEVPENPWEKKLEMEKAKANELNLGEDKNPWDKSDKEINPVEIEDRNPWETKLEKDKSASKELDMGLEI